MIQWNKELRNMLCRMCKWPLRPGQKGRTHKRKRRGTRKPREI